jgi:hypothetical protein
MNRVGYVIIDLFWFFCLFYRNWELRIPSYLVIFRGGEERKGFCGGMACLCNSVLCDTTDYRLYGNAYN